MNQVKNKGKCIKNLVILILITLFYLSFNMVFAQATVDIKINVPSNFQEGDILSFNYNLINGEDIEIITRAGLDCPLVSVPSKDQKISLEANQVSTKEYNIGFIIKGSIEPQTCIAYVQILIPVEQREEKTFEIITDPSFKFNINLDKKVFVKNEEIKIDYDSAVSGVKIEAVLIYPSGTKKDITLPKTITADKIGTYKLEITVSKEGYKTIIKKFQFGVIETKADFETIKSDVNSREVKGRKIFKSILFIALFLIFLGLIIISVKILLNKLNQESTVKEPSSINKRAKIDLEK